MIVKILRIFLFTFSIIFSNQSFSLTEKIKLYTIFYFSEIEQLTVVDIKKAFFNVLMKVSGESLETIKKSYAKVSTKQISNSIISSNSNLNIKNAYWELTFDHKKINEFLTQKNYLVWGTPRPVIKVWLIDKDELGQLKLYSDETIDSEISNVIDKVQLNRAIEFKLPNAIEEKKLYLYENSHEGLFKLIKEDYNNEYFLTLKLKKNSVFWQLEWSIYVNGLLLNSGELYESYKVTALQKSLQLVTHSIYKFEEKKLKVLSKFSVVIDKINDFKQYEQFTALLKKSRWFNHYLISQVNNNQVVIELTLKGKGIRYFEDMSKLGINVVEHDNIANQMYIELN